MEMDIFGVLVEGRWAGAITLIDRYSRNDDKASAAWSVVG